MESLPRHLLDEILLRLDLKSLAVSKCSKRFLHSHISSDPFKSEYSSRVKSGLLDISVYGTRKLYYHSLGDSRPQRTLNILKECRILGSCSGLLLLYVGYLYVANPLTKKFRFLSQQPLRSSLNGTENWNATKYIGLAVNQIDQTTNTQSFKVVYMKEETYSNRTIYTFEINAGYSWQLSKLRITCGPSQLDKLFRRPVYFDGYLHWLRRDGRIIAFNPETEQARVITTKFPQELSFRNLFAAGNNSLTLISAANDVIDIYALENTLSDPNWVLVKQIQNRVLNKRSLALWAVAAYDGKCLVLREYFSGRLLHGYDLRANKWEVIGSINGFGDAYRDFFQFIPSSSSVIGLDSKEKEVMCASDDQKKSISDVRSIMGLVIDGVSLENGKGTEKKKEGSNNKERRVKSRYLRN